MPRHYFLVREPVFNRNEQISFYSVYLRSRESPHTFPEEFINNPALASLIVTDLILTEGYYRTGNALNLIIKLPLEAIQNIHYFDLLNLNKIEFSVKSHWLKLTEKDYQRLRENIKKLKERGAQFFFDIGYAMEPYGYKLLSEFADFITLKVEDLELLEEKNRKLSEREKEKLKLLREFLGTKPCKVNGIQTEEQLTLAKKYCEYLSGTYLGFPQIVKPLIPFIINLKVLLEIIKMVEKGESIEKIAEKLKEDPILTIKILKLESHVGNRKDFESITEALKLLNLDRIHNYLMLLFALRSIETSTLDREVYKKLLSTAFLSEEIAKLKNKNPDFAHLGGLLVGFSRIYDINILSLIVDLGLSPNVRNAFVKEKEPSWYCIFLLTEYMVFDHPNNPPKDLQFCVEKLNLDLSKLETLGTVAEEKASEYSKNLFQFRKNFHEH